ncbi:tetratricopeptide repeat-containing diguanylate cyclase [Novosphingobium rosa]|uniref:tetratricopeptide repeat-containing diguanylate cyclase n=1 Tax=Novosphingobium rosa TaxID=76978 RepID=UPI0008314193|nr:GGDEF domain-containing protein [Novosphingobium rosa]
MSRSASGIARERLAEAERLSRSGLPISAIALAEQVRNEALANGSQHIYALSTSQLSWYYFMTARYEQGAVHALEAIELWQVTGDAAREASCRCYYAWQLCQMGMPGAEHEAMQALRQAEKAGDPAALCLAQNTVAVVLWMYKQFEQALDFSTQAVALARTVDDPVALGWWLINDGGIRGDHAAIKAAQGDRRDLVATVDHATSLTEEALALALAHQDHWGARICLGNLAEFALHLGDTDRAMAHMDHWQQLPGELGDRDLTQYHRCNGQVLIAQGRIDEAIVALKTGVEHADQVNDLESGVPGCQALAEAYERKGDFKMALHWHREFHEHYVRYCTHTAQRSARVAATQYETEQLRNQSETARLQAQALEVSNLELTQETDRLKKANLEDPLTGLYNRRALEAALAETQKTGAAYAIALLDVDHFKRINDRFSHLVGDEVLRQIAGILGGLIRKSEFLARFGGEEFVLLMPDMGSAEAAVLCERLRSAVEAWNWAEQNTELAVTISIGIASTDGTDAPTAILAAADALLYQAKAKGRNRVEVSHATGA